MDDLSLLLASKDAFLSLSMQKIKTLKQAEELQKSNPNQKVQSIIDHYHNTRLNVFSAMNDDNSYIDFSSANFSFNQKEPLSYYWSSPSIVEIIGQKGSGKTALALNCVLQFSKKYPQKTITILNCSGGITVNRLSPFLKLNLEYIDIFSPEDIQDVMTILKKRTATGIIFIDGVSSIIMGSSHRIGLGQNLAALKQNGWSIIVTNLIQGKLEVDQKEVMNTQSYFPNIFGSIIDCRLRIDQHESQTNFFVVRTLKNINNKPYQFITEMDVRGLSGLILQKLI